MLLIRETSVSFVSGTIVGAEDGSGVEMSIGLYKGGVMGRGLNIVGPNWVDDKLSAFPNALLLWLALRRSKHTATAHTRTLRRFGNAGSTCKFSATVQILLMIRSTISTGTSKVEVARVEGSRRLRIAALGYSLD